MKKELVLIISGFIIGLGVILISQFYKDNKSEKILTINELFTIYDQNIQDIKNNMEMITESNEDFDWWILKDFNIEDKDYETSLNSLVADVRMAYLEYTDEEQMYTNSNPIRKYREKEYITKKQLEKLNLDMKEEMLSGNINRFNKYSTLLISKDEELRNIFLNQTEKITKMKQLSILTNTNSTYSELLFKKIIEVSYVKDISEFLIKEYNRLKYLEN